MHFETQVGEFAEANKGIVCEPKLQTYDCMRFLVILESTATATNLAFRLLRVKLRRRQKKPMSKRCGTVVHQLLLPTYKKPRSYSLSKPRPQEQNQMI